jgi:hypothetical protein
VHSDFLQLRHDHWATLRHDHWATLLLQQGSVDA